MSFHSAVPLAATLLHHTDLVAAGVLQDLGFHRNPGDIRRADRHCGVVREEQYLIEYELGTRFLAYARNADLLPLRYLLLEAFDIDNGEHVRESVEILLRVSKGNPTKKMVIHKGLTDDTLLEVQCRKSTDGKFVALKLHLKIRQLHALPVIVEVNHAILLKSLQIAVLLEFLHTHLQPTDFRIVAARKV